MGDDINDHDLDNPIIFQSENSSSETIFTNNPEGVIPNQATEKMEIHHSKDHKNHLKNWKSYLFEFFMLFFAVFCGFVSEYWLEHRIERDREKEYIKSEIADLKTDTLMFNNFSLAGNRQIEGYRKMVVTINRFLEGEVVAKELIKINNKYGGGYVSVDITDRTISQLKSGGLRLIRNQGASDAISQYYNITGNEILSQTEIMKNQQVKMMDLATKIFDNTYNTDTTLYQKLESKKISFDAMMISRDPKLLKEYANTIQIQIGILDYYMAQVRNQKYYALNTITLLKKEYHLENE